MLHTANPITGAKGEVFGELVQGMGEALVGNHPGRALSFKSAADSSQSVEVCLQHFAHTSLSVCSCCLRSCKFICGSDQSYCCLLPVRWVLIKIHELQILALPAKRVGFFAANGALIARSDSNGEDLEAFAGAGNAFCNALCD